jgi:hypothetical protein
VNGASTPLNVACTANGDYSWYYTGSAVVTVPASAAGGSFSVSVSVQEVVPLLQVVCIPNCTWTHSYGIDRSYDVATPTTSTNAPAPPTTTVVAAPTTTAAVAAPPAPTTTAAAAGAQAVETTTVAAPAKTLTAVPRSAARRAPCEGHGPEGPARRRADDPEQ